ncbi:hypothetical protein ACWGGS_24800 [Streptomyces decoyicus]
MLLARSCHISVPSLERNARPGVDAVARQVAQPDPAARRKLTPQDHYIAGRVCARHSVIHRTGAGLDAPRVALTQIVN